MSWDTDHGDTEASRRTRLIIHHGDTANTALFYDRHGGCTATRFPDNIIKQGVSEG
ncbi:MAG TPA: hypothetical protein VMC84_07830 [Methanocella sp.]|nr:hypothetical protein [Methanocella sp.]